MTIGIGIDSGGTFTDGVVLDLNTGEIISKVKVPTTHENLLLGIRECLIMLKRPPDQTVTVVSLSTTLATNAVVEGKGSQVGAILIGYELKGDIPSPHTYCIKGGHDSLGNALEELDLAAATTIIRELKGKVEAFAVSAIMSVRNPEHELAIKELIKKETGCPVICGHELTNVLGVHERAVTAVLNARLIPIIKELIVAVRQVMKEQKIDAPLMIVKGDGALVAAEIALERPIETLLSGPAASIIGARYLSDIQDGIVADMGGTTTDIAVINNGLPEISEEGASVGGWLTRVKAVKMHTIGLGGDSYIQVDKKGGIKIGPRRVVPISSIAVKYPNIKKELFELTKKEYFPVRHQPGDIIAFVPRENSINRTPFEQKLAGILNVSPHTIWYVGEMLGIDPDLLPIKDLEDEGVLVRCGITPTDVLCSFGNFPFGDSEAAVIGIKLITRAMRISEEDFYHKIDQEITARLVSILIDQVINRSDSTHKGGFDYALIINKLFSSDKDDLEISVKLNKPVVAVGAPARAYFPQAVEKLNGHLIIPENAEVANAVGAVTGQVIEQVELLIRPNSSSGYTIYAPWQKNDIPNCDLDKVKEIAVKEVREHVLQKATMAGGYDINIVIDMDDIYVNTVIMGETCFLECKVMAKAVGNAYKSFLGSDSVDNIILY